MAETNTQQLQTNTLTLDKLLAIAGAIFHLSEGSNQRTVEVYGDISDIYSAKQYNESHILRENDDPSDIMGSLRRSKRRCYDPCDYIYGVLGMTRIKIPRMTDPNAVWRHFLSELDDLLPLYDERWVDHADEIDLQKVDNIGELHTKLWRIYLALDK
ncbi:predicted protein [Lichtheimia corymbifera JMRC:FSU:9682]|uniref:Uncharacterized protein n=1 Tax=Lichtheimia corymbifera JMRC:FSU:9682 TaxID=1263082 RepID=A0A068RZE4_9FUNG|nr:predicted protein [Lichtheimia corymbifera JMRC:FSU:9682]